MNDQQVQQIVNALKSVSSSLTYLAFMVVLGSFYVGCQIGIHH